MSLFRLGSAPSLLFVLAINSAGSLSGQKIQQLITLDPTGKFFVNPGTGQPVWIQGDSPQALALQVRTEDVEAYLTDR